MTGRHRNRHLAQRAHRGFSLVELMVAMALSLILLAGVLAIFASSRTTYETTDRLSRIQESGRFALDSIVRDLRSAGYLGCSRRADFVSTLADLDGVPPQDTLLWDFETPVEGFDAQGGTWLPALDEDVAVGAVAAGDALVVRGPRGEFEPVRVISPMNDTMDSVTVAAAPELLDDGDVVLISDCEARSIFQITSIVAGVITHTDDAPPPGTPGNDSEDLEAQFTEAAELIPLRSVVYYLADNELTPGAGTSLWRRISDGGAPEELVEGVESFQVQFGEEVGADLEYRRADEVVEWGNVATVRIAVLVRSMSEYGTDTGLASYDVLDEVVPNPGDRHMRQVFTTTVNLRNRGVE
jgi:type IV pilus assembly protein PilW